MNLPALPADIGPDEYEVRFVMHECRGCGERSEWYRADTDSAHSGWDGDHAREGKGHRKFYLYSFTRNTAQILFM